MLQLPGTPAQQASSLIFDLRTPLVSGLSFLSCLQAKTPVAPTITNMLKIAEPMIVPTPPFDGMKKVQTIDLASVGACERSTETQRVCLFIQMET